MVRTADASTVVENIMISPRLSRRAMRAALYLLVTILSALFMFPFFWTVSSSLKQAWEMFLFPPRVFPSLPQWGNYARVLDTIPYGLWFYNTIVVVSLATSGAVISSAIAAYSFARFSYRGKNVLFMITLSTMTLPAQVTLIPQFILFHKLGWIDSTKPLWMPAWFGGGAFYIFLMRQFMMSLPREIDEAALIDGAGKALIFWRIVLPLCKPALATAAIISFIGSWGDFLGPVIYLNTREKFTLAVGLHYFRVVPETSSEPLHHILMAACVLTSTPPLILFFLFQRYFVRGVVLSGIKG